MTKIGIIAFSEKGGILGRFLADEFGKTGCVTEGYLSERHYVKGMGTFTDLNSIVHDLFERKDIIIFVGACGIAVRALAPCIKNKMEDPGVIVVDECGKYVISLLSGHVGRANAFTDQAAQILGGEPVITTATDRNGAFAVDEWAVRNCLRIVEPAMVKEISSRILAGEKVGFYSDFGIKGLLPEGLTKECGTEAGILVSRHRSCLYEKKFPVTCTLVPMDLVVGVGCRKGKSFCELDGFLRIVMEENGLMAERIGKLCSISAKAEEKGLQALAKAYGIPFETFSADQLLQAEGSFAASDFVEAQMGVDNVCERSACIGSGGGIRLVGKQAFEGMTIAVYRREMEITF